METHGGKFIDLANIDPCLVDVEDVAYHLARIFRFCGAAESTVAEHAVQCADLAYNCGEDIEIQFACLHHDSHEYLFGDMPHDVKKMCPDYFNLEKIGQRVVLRALGVKWSDMIADIVKEYDDWSARIEAYNYLPSMGKHWPTSWRSVPDKYMHCIPQSPYHAERLFLKYHDHLWKSLP